MNYLKVWDEHRTLYDPPCRAFGSVAPYWCDDCKQPVWSEPEAICTHRGCGWEYMYGPEGDDYEWECPHCGSGEVYKNNSKKPYQTHYTVTKRAKVPTKRSAACN